MTHCNLNNSQISGFNRQLVKQYQYINYFRFYYFKKRIWIFSSVGFELSHRRIQHIVDFNENGKNDTYQLKKILQILHQILSFVLLQPVFLLLLLTTTFTCATTLTVTFTITLAQTFINFFFLSYDENYVMTGFLPYVAW
ncbi:Hypothetical_protein [Hexamita inflata]|uniref:Hypothetical_protein n=1 Tax=Hexamita inflata TaxID=28002 RepID=A0AA86NSG6_9EUKA|nr:Hypothetical protein HINF_LOCUS11681 [Hexamita inflata]